MRTLLLLILFTTIQHFAFSQKKELFEWAGGVQNLSMSFEDFTVLSDNAVIAIAHQTSLTTPTRLGKVKFMHGNGEEYPMSLRNQDASFLIKFNAEGVVMWYFVMYDAFGTLYQVEKSANDEILVLAQVTRGKIGRGEGQYVRPVELPSGRSILHLSTDGKITKSVALQNSTWMKLDRLIFKSYMDGKYLIAGPSGAKTLAKQLKVTNPVNSDGDYIALYSNTGTLIWGDVIFHTQGPGSLNSFDISIANDGTIYLGSTYKNHALFSNGKQFLAPSKYNSNFKNEAFIISYSPSGAINWIQRNGGLSYLNTLAASDDGVYVGLRLTANKLFSTPVDTTQHKRFGIALISKKGKVKWEKIAAMRQSYDMCVDQQGNLLLLGGFNRYKLNNRSFFKDIPITKDDKNFISIIDRKG
ncbi:MAG: hypothetical protein ACPGJS_09240, partial [Flammeovirgaceae bacterium]